MTVSAEDDKKLSIQELKKGVRRVIDGLDKKELANLFIRLAEAQNVEARSAFLQTLELCQNKPQESSGTTELDAGECLKAILEQAKERQEHIDSGDYEMLDDWDWEERCDNRYGYYDDEEPEALNEDLMDGVKAIAGSADNYFLDQKFTLAGPIYDALLEFELKAKQGGLVYARVIDDQEMWFRHLRCVYENNSPNKRIARLYEEMKNISSNSQSFQMPLPSLREVCASCSEAMPGYKEFLPEWAAFLQSQNKPTAKRLWVEALVLMGRADKALAWLETSGNEYPQAWLEYLACLGHNEEWALLAVGCDKALRYLTDCHCRKTAAEYLIDAGLKLGNTTHLVAGHQAAILANPSLRGLESMVNAIPRGAERIELLKSVDSSLPADNFSRTHAAVKLLLGNVQECLDAVDREKTVGWSNPRNSLPAVVSGGMLALCAGGSDKSVPSKVRKFAELYLDPSRELFMAETRGGKNNRPEGGLVSEISKSFEGDSGMSSKTQAMVMDFTRQAVSARADKIVSNTFRNAYGRAAAGLLAWAETARALNRKQEGDELIRAFRSRYPRHSAFLRELSVPGFPGSA